MAGLTDPAKELAELCEKLAIVSKERGDQHLASLFQVTPWSADFYRIIFTIIERADYVSRFVETLDTDQDTKDEIEYAISRIKSAFNLQTLGSNWNNSGIGRTLLGDSYSRVLKTLSIHMREKVSYPKLTEDEIKEILSEIDDLDSWLNEHQLVEQDFIRQAIVEGLSQFRFRLLRLTWLGWGYTIESLREVVGAYMALQHGTIAGGNSPDSEAVLKKVEKTLTKIYSKMKTGKEAYEMADWLLNAYTATMLAGKAAVAGFITYSGPS